MFSIAYGGRIKIRRGQAQGFGLDSDSGAAGEQLLSHSRIDLSNHLKSLAKLFFLLHPISGWQIAGHSRKLGTNGNSIRIPESTPARFNEPSVAWLDTLSGLALGSSDGKFVKEMLSLVCSPRCRTVSMMEDKAGREMEECIGKLLTAEEDEDVVDILGRNVRLLFQPEFIWRLEARREEAETEMHADEITRLTELVLDFMEVLTETAHEIQENVIELEKTAEEVVANLTAQGMIKNLTAGVARKQAGKPKRRVAPTTESFRMNKTEALFDKRDQKRFFLQKLFDAAAAGEQRLDAVLHEKRDELDPDFFDYMKWEVDEAIKEKNRKLLEILEIVVQRATLETERGVPGLGVLNKLLDSRNPYARQDIYNRELRNGGVELEEKQAAFMKLLWDLKNELEKRIVRGDEVDDDLMQIVNAIAQETLDLKLAADNVDKEHVVWREIPESELAQHFSPR